MPEETDHLPHLLVLYDTFPCRHARRVNSVHDNPMQLAIGIVLNVLGIQIRNGWRHLLRERNPGPLAVHPVADLAMMPKMFSPLLDVGLCIGDGIWIVLTADCDLLLNLGHDFIFNRTWLADFASGERTKHAEHRHNGQMFHKFPSFETESTKSEFSKFLQSSNHRCFVIFSYRSLN